MYSLCCCGEVRSDGVNRKARSWLLTLKKLGRKIRSFSIKLRKLLLLFPESVDFRRLSEQQKIFLKPRLDVAGEVLSHGATSNFANNYPAPLSSSLLLFSHSLLSVQSLPFFFSVHRSFSRLILPSLHSFSVFSVFGFSFFISLFLPLLFCSYCSFFLPFFFCLSSFSSPSSLFFFISLIFSFPLSFPPCLYFLFSPPSILFPCFLPSFLPAFFFLSLFLISVLSFLFFPCSFISFFHFLSYLPSLTSLLSFLTSFFFL